jgi:hypothetical protein
MRGGHFSRSTKASLAAHRNYSAIEKFSPRASMPMTLFWYATSVMATWMVLSVIKEFNA